MVRVMKYFHNWSSHGHLLDTASAADIAFLTLIGLRASFYVLGERDLELRRYEHRLLGAVDTDFDSIVLSKRLARSCVDAKSLLVELVGKRSTLKRQRVWLLQDQSGI